jgi:hypothetical protein
MTETYVPQPGTIDARAIAHLRTLPVGAMLAAGVLADALDVDRDDLVPALERAWRAGAVAREAGSSGVRWGVGHPKLRTLAGSPAVSADDDIDDDPIVRRVVPASKSAGVSLLDRPAWTPPKEDPVNKPLVTPPQPKKPRAAAPAFDPLTIELKKDRPLPPSITSAASRYQALLDRMQPGDSVDLPTAAAKSLVSAAKKAKVKLATRAIDDTTTGVWRL